MIAAVVTDSLLVTTTHGIILLATVAGAVSSFLNRKKLNKIEVIINGGLTDKIRAALKERDAP